MDLLAELQAIGLDTQTASELVTKFASGRAVFDRDESSPRDRRAVAIQAALVALGEFARYSEALRTIVAWLNGALGELTTLDAGRYWHVRALISLRLENAPTAVARQLNASVRALLRDGSPRAQRYLARVHDSLAQLLHQQGRLSEALQELDRSLELRDPEDRSGLAISYGNRGRLWMDLGDFEKAADDLAIDLKIVEEINPEARGVRSQLVSHLGNCELHLGRVEDARRSYEHARTLALEGQDVVGDVFATLGLGRVALASGDARAASEAVAAADARLASVALPDRLGAGLSALRCKLSADVQFARGEIDGAIASYETGIRELDRAARVSPMEYAEAYRELATALAAKHLHQDAARALRLALRHLDGTAAAELRREVEAQLQRVSNDSWLLHAAGRFVGQHQIELLLDEGGKPGFRGSVRSVVVLFSDIRGFTTLAERLPAETVIAFLNDYLARMTRSIESCGGSVDKFIGDAVMAIFPMDDRARGGHALEAALAMHDELERMNRSPIEPALAALEAGIGIHGGDVVSGLIGSPQKREYTVIGDVVNTASRLEGMTKQLGATTLVTSDVLTEDHRRRYLLRPFGRLTPKGRATPIEVFDVAGERDGSAEAMLMEAEIARVAAALTTLVARDFAGAATAFADLALETRATPRHLGYAMLGDRARRFAAVPPGREWAGEIPLSEK